MCVNRFQEKKIFTWACLSLEVSVNLWMLFNNWTFFFPVCNIYLKGLRYTSLHNCNESLLYVGGKIKEHYKYLHASVPRKVAFIVERDRMLEV